VCSNPINQLETVNFGGMGHDLRHNSLQKPIRANIIGGMTPWLSTGTKKDKESGEISTVLSHSAGTI